MKKFGLLFIALAALLAACNDNDGDYAAYAFFVTVKTRAGSDYYFQTDDQKTFYPSDKSRIAGYEAREGQRAILWFNLLPDAVAGYDFNISAYYIEDIYTAAARIITQEELDALADDPVSLLDAQLSRTHLTLRLAYPVTDNSKHRFHLVRAQAAGEQTPTHAGYLDVELRHDAGEDTPDDDRAYYVSLSLEELGESMQHMKGLTMRISTQLNGIQHVQITTR